MKLNFPHLTPPYCGQKEANQQMTLNSSILQMAWAKISKGQNVELFPQRIPRIGFFDEIEEKETKEYRIESKNFRNLISNEFEKHPADQEINLPLVEFGIRIGLTECILKLKNESNARVEVLKDIAKTRKNIHENSTHDCNDLLSFLKNNQLSLEDSALISNRIIVKKYRYLRGKTLEKEQQLVNTVLQAINEGKNDTFYRKMRTATLARGVAMSKLIEPERALFLINNAIDTIRNAEASDEYENLIKKELLLTTLLTKAKTLKTNNMKNECFNQLVELTEIDPMDSTTWSEVGLEQYESGFFNNAIRSFEKAYFLGPPAIALNAFYAGVAHKELEEYSEALKWLRKSSNSDLTALSPRIEEVMILKKTSKTKDAKELATSILKNDDLIEQMDEEEITCLKNI